MDDDLGSSTDADCERILVMRGSSRETMMKRERTKWGRGGRVYDDHDGYERYADEDEEYRSSVSPISPSLYVSPVKEAINVPSALMYKVDPNLFLGMAGHLP